MSEPCNIAMVLVSALRVRGQNTVYGSRSLKIALARGVDPQRMMVGRKDIVGPVATNATEHGRAQNRPTEGRFEGM